MVDIDTNLVITQDMTSIRVEVLRHLDDVAKFTGCDVFLLNPKHADSEGPASSYGNGSDLRFDQRLRIAIYGDPESSEHAKTRVLIMIDKVASFSRELHQKHDKLIVGQLHRTVDIMRLELSLHTIICGRTRKNIRLIEAASNTAIYFPPPFPRIYGYTPPGAHRRGEDEVFITGDNQECINIAKKKLHELVLNTKCYVKDVMVSAPKIDSILLDRLDKVRKVMETNGSYVLFPQLGSQRGLIRVQGTEILHVERTVREIMALV